MREQIEARIEEWQQGLERMQAQRARLAQQIQELDIAIQRNVGAIAGAQELLKMIEVSEPALSTTALDGIEAPLSSNGVREHA